MKIPRPFLWLLLLGSAPLLGAAASFEGRFSLRIQDENGTRVVSGAMKGDFMRVEIPSDDGGWIVSFADFVHKELSVVLPGQSFYAAMPIEDAVVKISEARTALGQTALQTTGETATLLGYPCVKYLSKDKDGGITEIWAATGIGSKKTSAALLPLTRGTAERELLAQGGFPLRIIGKTSGGVPRFRMEVISMGKQTLADGLFAPPASYQKLPVGGLLKGGFNLFGGS